MKKSIKDMKVYFASPWFTPEQEAREVRVKNKLRELGFNVWSPKENCVCSPISSEDLRKKVFDDNCKNIETSNILFAITDGKDMGTIWEAGYANGLNRTCSIINEATKKAFEVDLGYTPIKIVYYCETLGKNGQFNLMLAQSGDIVIQSFEDLDKLPELIENEEKKEYVGIVE